MLRTIEVSVDIDSKIDQVRGPYTKSAIYNLAAYRLLKTRTLLQIHAELKRLDAPCRGGTKGRPKTKKKPAKS